MQQIPTAPTPADTPYPPANDLDQALASAIAARDLDAILLEVQDYARRVPPPDRPLLAPVSGLRSTIDPASTKALDPAFGSDWFHLLLYNAGNACLRAGELELAVALYKQSLIGCSLPSLYNNLGFVMKRQGRYAEALRWYRKAIERDPGYLNGYLRAAKLVVLHPTDDTTVGMLLAGFVEQGGTAALVEGYLRQLEPELARQLWPVFGACIPLTGEPPAADA